MLEAPSRSSFLPGVPDPITPMIRPESEDLSGFLAEELRRRAVSCTDTWIELLRERLAVRPARLLPSDSVRDHVPGVVAEIGEHLREPGRELSGDSVEALRTFAELRRQQGYRESEVLAELGTLHLTIFAEFADALSRFDGAARAASVAEVTARLDAILGNVDRVVVGVLRERERQEDRELSRRLASFVRTLMHEVRDPLNAATQSGRMLRDEDLPAGEEARLADVVVRNLEKIGALLDDLTMVEDVETARADGRWVSLREAIEDAVAHTEEQARSYGVDVEVEGEIPDVTVEAGAVEVPLRNLVSNAVKYSDGTKTRRWVRIRVAPVGEDDAVGVSRWGISVADNGIGIPDAVREQVFRRRFRAHPDVADGTGLGLAIARRMASLRGGRIWFESTPGEGSTFHLELREQQVDPDEG